VASHLDIFVIQHLFKHHVAFIQASVQRHLFEPCGICSSRAAFVQAVTAKDKVYKVDKTELPKLLAEEVVKMGLSAVLTI